MKSAFALVIAVAFICSAGCVTSRALGPRGKISVKVPANAQVDRPFNVVFSEVGGVGVTLTNTTYLIADILGQTEEDMDTGLLGPRVIEIAPNGELLVEFVLSKGMLLASNVERTPSGYLQITDTNKPVRFIIGYQGCDALGNEVRFSKSYEIHLSN